MKTRTVAAAIACTMLIAQPTFAQQSVSRIFPSDIKNDYSLQSEPKTVALSAHNDADTTLCMNATAQMSEMLREGMVVVPQIGAIAAAQVDLKTHLSFIYWNTEVFSVNGNIIECTASVGMQWKTVDETAIHEMGSANLTYTVERGRNDMYKVSIPKTFSWVVKPITENIY